MATGLFSLLISFGCFWFSFTFIKTYFTVKKWEKVEATVLSKEAKILEKFSTSRSPYGVFIEYSYLYKNIEYKNDKVYLVELMGGQANHMKETADKVMASVPDKVQVFVNPEDPKQAVIFCDGLGLYLFVFGMGVMALLIGLVSVFKK